MIRSASGKENEIIGLRFAGDRFFFFIAETTGNERGRSPLLSAPVRRRQEETGTAVAEIFARQHRRGPDRQTQRSETRKQAATTAIKAVGEKAGATGTAGIARTAGAGPGLRSDRQPERQAAGARGYRSEGLPKRQAAGTTGTENPAAGEYRKTDAKSPAAECSRTCRTKMRDSPHRVYFRSASAEASGAAARNPASSVLSS